jgi:hypothetical protein
MPYSTLVVPQSLQKSVTSTAAVVLRSVTLSVPAFVVSAARNNTGTLYVGGSNVVAGASPIGIPLNAGESVSFSPFNKVDTQIYPYDLNGFYARASGGTQRLTITILNQTKNNPNP